MLIEVPIEDRFRIWYEEPLAELAKFKRGNGGILALIVVMPLYERAYNFEDSKSNVPDGRAKWVKDDLGLKSDLEAKLFWNVFRDGFCHFGSALEVSHNKRLEGEDIPKISLDGKHPDLPVFEDIDGKSIIKLNPWGLVSHVLRKYHGQTELLEYARAPLLPLHYLVKDKETSSPNPDTPTNPHKD